MREFVMALPPVAADRRIVVATWNGRGYECYACHAMHSTHEAAAQHFQSHVPRKG